MKLESGDALVLRDAAGNYFLIPRTLIELHRVPEERQGELQTAFGGDGDGVDAAVCEWLFGSWSPFLWGRWMGAQAR